ncbi:MAG: polysaccharide biosynthesis/export family protein [Verrucomicrobiia bacterium]
MSEELNLEVGSPRRKRAQGQDHSNSYSNGEHSGPRARYRPQPTRPDSGPGWESAYQRPGETQPAPFNFWRILEILCGRWSWLLLACALGGFLAFVVGLKLTNYTAAVSLIRRENPNAFTAGGGDNLAPQAYISRELSAQTLFGLMRSPEVFRRVSEKANPPVSPDRLAKAFKVVPERNADFVTLALSGKEPSDVLAKWANLCADEVVQYTRELQASEAGSISDFLALKLLAVESELAHVNEEMARFSANAQSIDVDKEVEAYTSKLVEVETRSETARIERDTVDLRIQNFRKALAEQSPGNDRLQTALDELDRLYAKGYTDLHPDVVRQRAVVANVEKQGQSPTPTSAGSTGSLLGTRNRGGTFASTIQFEILQLQGLKEVRDRELQEYASLKSRLQDKAKSLSKTAVEYAQLKAGQKRLSDLRITLLSKQQEAELLRDNALGYFKVHSYATPEQVTGRKRFFAVAVLSAVGGLLGLLAASALVFIAQAIDSRIKTASDLERVTRLPLLATLGDLRKMKPEEQINWAFRTLTILQGKLNSASDETLVCGFISSRHGEGRSTWVNLLVSAASQRGMRILTVATRPSSAADEMPERMSKELALLPTGSATTLTKNVLAYPAQVTEQFNDPKAQPIVHIPLPGWVWNLERRQQWRTALDHWQEIPNLVLLVELPPACQPESVLLAEHLPQVIWLAGSGIPEMDETQAQLETLRHARCNLVGCVLNREPSSPVRRSFAKWARRFSALAFGAWLATGSVQAEPSVPSLATPCLSKPVASLLTLVLPVTAAVSDEATAAPRAFSATASAKRAPWQERLTLGPGDTLDIFLYGRPELSRTNVVVGPDGKLNYLQLQGFPAAGRTIDELRAAFDEQLATFYVTPRTIVIPASFNSKKYFILGKVANEGVFTLDRPLTVLEAVARAKGLQTGAGERGTVDVADLSRSFLVRQGQRVPVDFVKLFYQGDLSQNIPLEPNDYLYFAAAEPQEIYVLGEVLSPGVVSVGSRPSLLPVLSARGGFTEKAWRKRVLVVRGSLKQPEAFAVDTPAILAGRTPDFKMQPGDIVYVNARPWWKVEELLDIAAQSFIEAAVTAWAGNYVPAAITQPIVPHP